jgi:PAS domain-containing protein
MANESKSEVKEKFDFWFGQWEKTVQTPQIRLSSRPQDYRNNEPYREIVNLGGEVLPFVIEKVQQGVFFLNQAVVEITGIKIEDMVGKERGFLSEQQRSALLLTWWNSQKQ